MGEIKAGVTLMQDFCRPRTEKFQEYIDYMDREEAQRNNAITTYNMMIYEQDIRAELDGYALGERRG